MLDYLKEYGSVPLSAAPLNDVDRLIFSQLAYMDFESVTEAGCPFSYALAHASFADSPDPSEARFSFQKKDDRRLALLASTCPRYESVRFAGFVRRYDAQAETQFAALALHVADHHLLVAFRGTDNTLAGWKEDFNLAFMDEIPAQRMAVAYSEEVSRSARTVTLTGHSKGGNLALYTACACSCALQDKIDLAVSFDGPGLNENVIRSEGFARVQGRMRAVLPKASLIGRLFQQPQDVRLIDSRVFSLLQHYPYFWKTGSMDFIYLARPTAVSALMGGTLMGLIRRLPPDAREQLICSVYEIFSSAEADTLNALASAWLRSAYSIVSGFFKTDPETRRLFLRALAALLSAAAEALAQELHR